MEKAHRDFMELSDSELVLALLKLYKARERQAAENKIMCGPAMHTQIVSAWFAAHGQKYKSMVNKARNRRLRARLNRLVVKGFLIAYDETDAVFWPQSPGDNQRGQIRRVKCFRPRSTLELIAAFSNEPPSGIGA